LPIDLGGSSQGLAYTSRDTLFGATFLIESHGLVDTMEAFVIDATLLLVEPGIAFPEAPTGANTRIEHFIDRINYWRVPRSPIHGFTIPVRTRQTNGTASA